MDITFLIVENGLQNCFVFQPVIKYFKPLTNDTIGMQKSNGLSDKSIKPPATANNSFHQ